MCNYFLELSKTNKNNDYINRQFESNEFYYNIFNRLNNTKREINYNSNLSKTQINNLKKYIKSKPFKVCDTDKNVGLAVLSNKLYDSLVIKELSNNEVYEEFSNDQNLEYNKDSFCIFMNGDIVDLKSKGFISKRLGDALFIDKKTETFGTFRLLMKLHKDKFSSRAVINNRSHFTWKLSLLIERVLRPFVEGMFSFLKDSQHLMQDLNNLKFDPNKVKLVSADFINMYPSIDQNDLIDKIIDFLNTKKFKCKDFCLKGFKFILQFLFKYNYFVYKKKIYRQKNGITMGTKCGPSLANIYVHIFEILVQNTYSTSILFYRRFIDDLFMIILSNFDLSILNNCFQNLKLTFSEEEIVNYLDLNISICKLTNKICFSLYTKSTNTFSYLLVTSNHKKSIFKNIIKGLLIRIKRICTNYSDFLFFSFKLKNHLLNRGYSSKLFNRIFNIINKCKREDLLPYKNKKAIDFNNKIYLKLSYDNSCDFIKPIIKSSFIECLKIKKEFIDIDLKFLNYNQPSLSSLLLHFRDNLNFLNSCNYKICSNLNCNTCYFSNSNYFINLNNFKLPILINSSCNTKNSIYIIECKLCNSYYIGESGKEFKDRFYKHIYSIKNFIPYKKYTPVAIHFNLKYHNFKEHLKFYIYDTIKPCIQDEFYDQLTLKSIYKERRHNLENIVYNFFKSFNMNTMNYYLPNLKYIRYDDQIYESYERNY